MKKYIRIGTRPSILANRQVEEINLRLPHLRFKVIHIETEGDRDKITPLDSIGKRNFFTYDIEKTLLNDSIDAAVHSAKDMDEILPKGLIIAAMTSSISPYECIISKDNIKLEELPAGALIGTSSCKRKNAIKAFRSDLKIKSIRGDVDNRIAQLDKGDFDAIIVAHAALIRLGYVDRITEILTPEIIEPHPLQGRLAIEIRQNRQDIYEIFRCIHET